MLFLGGRTTGKGLTEISYAYRLSNNKHHFGIVKCLKYSTMTKRNEKPRGAASGARARCGWAPPDTHSSAEATSPSSRTCPAPRQAWTLRFWFSFGTAFLWTRPRAAPSTLLRIPRQTPAAPPPPRRRRRRRLLPSRAAAAAAAAASPQLGVARRDCRMFRALSAPATAQSLVSSFPEVGPLGDAVPGLREERPGTPGHGHGPPQAA